MNNKILIKLIVPEVDSDFDVFIPVNEVMWKVKKMLAKCVSDLTGSNFGASDDFVLVNQDSGRIYKNNEIIIDTDIRNSSEIILMTKSL